MTQFRVFARPNGPTSHGGSFFGDRAMLSPGIALVQPAWATLERRWSCVSHRTRWEHERVKDFSSFHRSPVAFLHASAGSASSKRSNWYHGKTLAPAPRARRAARSRKTPNDGIVNLSPRYEILRVLAACPGDVSFKLQCRPPRSLEFETEFVLEAVTRTTLYHGRVQPLRVLTT
eukprot:3389358-Prymnesium_polylepis.1